MAQQCLCHIYPAQHSMRESDILVCSPQSQRILRNRQQCLCHICPVAALDA
jgi:hypothetical protein